FGAKPNLIQALKTVAYAWTAWWIAGIGVIVPWLGLLIVLAGGVYSIYLLYLGLPHTMQCPPEKAGGYTAVSVIIAIVLGWIVSLILGLIFVGALGKMMGAMSGTNGPVEALAPDQIKAFLPAAVGNLKRTGISAERNGAMG